MKGLCAPLGVATVALVVAGAMPVWAWDPANPDDLAANAAANGALQTLGPDRGAITVVSDIRGLVSDIRDVVVPLAKAPDPKPPIEW